MKKELVVCKLCSEGISYEWALENSRIVNKKKLVKKHLRKYECYQQLIARERLNPSSNDEEEEKEVGGAVTISKRSSRCCICDRTPRRR